VTGCTAKTTQNRFVSALVLVAFVRVLTPRDTFGRQTLSQDSTRISTVCKPGKIHVSTRQSTISYESTELCCVNIHAYPLWICFYHLLLKCVDASYSWQRILPFQIQYDVWLYTNVLEGTITSSYKELQIESQTYKRHTQTHSLWHTHTYTHTDLFYRVPWFSTAQRRQPTPPNHNHQPTLGRKRGFC